MVMDALSRIEFEQLLNEDGPEIFWVQDGIVLQEDDLLIKSLPEHLQISVQHIVDNDLSGQEIDDFYEELNQYYDYLSLEHREVIDYDLEKAYEIIEVVFHNLKNNKYYKFDYTKSRYIDWKDMYNTISNLQEVVKKQKTKLIEYYDRVR